MAESVSGRNSRPATGRPSDVQPHAPLDERGDAVGLFQGDVEGRLADDGGAVVEQEHGGGVSISPSRLGRVTGWPRSSSVAMAEKVVPRSMPTTCMRVVSGQVDSGQSRMSAYGTKGSFRQ